MDAPNIYLSIRKSSKVHLYVNFSILRWIPGSWAEGSRQVQARVQAQAATQHDTKNSRRRSPYRRRRPVMSFPPARPMA